MFTTIFFRRLNCVTWMGVGWVNSLFLMLFIRASSKPKCPKLETGRGGLGPDTFTLCFCCRSITWILLRPLMSGCSS